MENCGWATAYVMQCDENKVTKILLQTWLSVYNVEFTINIATKEDISAHKRREEMRKLDKTYNQHTPYRNCSADKTYRPNKNKTDRNPEIYVAGICSQVRKLLLNRWKMWNFSCETNVMKILNLYKIVW